MSRWYRLSRSAFLAAGSAAFGLSACPVQVRAAARPAVTVFAAASLREAFTAAGPAFTKRFGYPVRFDFAGSDTLATQLQQGAPADVFASADERQMQRIGSLVTGTKTLARNRLVVIAAVASSVRAPADLARPGTKLILAAPTVPIGAYSRAALRNLDHERGYGPGFAARAERNVVSEEIDVKAVATKVALGEADAGIVYATDVTAVIGSKVRVLAFPRGVAPEATYPIAALKSAQNADGARAFVDFITSPDGRAFLRARGFEE
jgi:molybdate transport system substrate-binding protein